MHRTVLTLSLVLLATPAVAQTSISPTAKFAWSENCGWLNFRDASGGSAGVRDNRTYLSGFIWGENIGWINIGGTPANGVAFSNTSNTDFGVNVTAGGLLRGFAWGENVGWINFDVSAQIGPSIAARIDFAANRLRGFAWGENIGWINMDSSAAGQFPALTCYANCDESTTTPLLTPADFVCFLNRFRAGDPRANCDRSTAIPALTPADFVCFLNAFRAGCL